MRRATIRQEVKPTLTSYRTLLRGVSATATVLLFATICVAQNSSAPNQAAAPAKRSASPQTTAKQPAATQRPETPLGSDLQKYPGLLPEFGHLLQRLKQDVQAPDPRTQSRLLPLLPDSTMTYAALPNYGGVAHQTLAIFRDELQQSAVLRDWWTHGEPAASAPKIEQFLEQFDQMNQFLGDEIVLAGSFDAQKKSGSFLALAEIRKPGVDKFLQQWIAQAGGTAKAGVQVFDQQGLDKLPLTSNKDLLVLVRPDLIAATTDAAALCSLNARLKTPNREFATSAFGQRALQEYQGGVTILGAADIQKFLSQKPLGPNNDQAFQQSGFADMKYAIWKHARANGQSVSQAELSFTGPRHGAAAWLGKPTQLGSLDFVSPKAMAAFTLVLSSFPQVYDDIKALAGPPSQMNVFGAIEGGEKALNVSLKDDLLAQLAGELTVEVDNITDKQPAARLIFKVNDAARLQKTLAILLTAAQLPMEHFNDGRVAYDVVRVPNQGGPMPIAYAFLDGYWIIASKPETLLDAVQLHISGASLAHSQRFLAALPAGSAQPPRASALFYQDPTATIGVQMRQVSPEFADFLAQFAKDAPPSVARFYGEESSIREASSSGALDVGSALIVAAVAIPNLLRSRMAANEASAVGSMRSLNTAQVAYAVTFPNRGFARNLATLGQGTATPTKYSEDHAGLLDRSLASDNCNGDASCSKSGYQFRIITGCSKLAPCKEYVAVATPVDANTGTRSFCTTSDAIIRYRIGAPSTVPLTATQCRAWPPLK